MVASNAIGIDATFVESKSFHSFQRGKKSTIHSRLSCDYKNVIYLASCKKCRLQYVGSTRATLNFRKFKVALNHTIRIFVNFAKSCLLVCLSKVDNNKKKKFTTLSLNYKPLKL